MNLEVFMKYGQEETKEARSRQSGKKESKKLTRILLERRKTSTDNKEKPRRHEHSQAHGPTQQIPLPGRRNVNWRDKNFSEASAWFHSRHHISQGSHTPPYTTPAQLRW